MATPYSALEMPPGPFRLLLVEDNPEETELCQRALRSAGFTDPVTLARDGVEALERVSALSLELPHVIFLDLKLPRLDGIDVLRELKGDPARRQIPVVVLSSSDEPRDIETCYALGANSYVVKPVDPDVFAHLIGELASYWSTVNRRLR